MVNIRITCIEEYNFLRASMDLEWDMQWIPDESVFPFWVCIKNNSFPKLLRLPESGLQIEFHTFLAALRGKQSNASI